MPPSTWKALLPDLPVHGCVNVPSSEVYRKWSLPSLCTPHPALASPLPPSHTAVVPVSGFPGSASPRAEGEFLETNPCLLWSPRGTRKPLFAEWTDTRTFSLHQVPESKGIHSRGHSPLRRRSQAPPTVGFLPGPSTFSDGGRKGGRDWKEKRKGGCEASDPKVPTLWWRPPLGQSRPTQPPRKSATPTNFEAPRRTRPAACAPQGDGPPDPRTPGTSGPGVSAPCRSSMRAAGLRRPGGKGAWRGRRSP